MATTYATTAELAARMSSTSVSTTVLQALLDTAAAMIDRITRDPPLGNEAFKVSSSATRYYNDYLREDGVIEIDDALTVTLLKRGGTTISAANYKLYPYNPGSGPYTRIILLAAATSIPLLLLPLGGTAYNYPYRYQGTAQIEVTGTWGYCTAATAIPEIKEAVLRQAIRMWEWQNVGKADLEAGSSRRHTPSNPYAHLDPTVLQLIQPYVKTEGMYVT